MKGYHSKGKGIGMVYDDIYLVNGARTPFGKMGGTLGRVSPTDLGIYASRSALEKSGIKGEDIDQVIFANIGQSSPDAYFIPRHISLYAGIPVEVPSVLVNRICGSGFEVIANGAEQIALGKAATVLCGGTENMTMAPTVSFGNRMGYTLGNPGFVDMLWEALNDTASVSVGLTSENVAEKYKINRDDTDSFAKQSMDRAIAARERGFFTDEILPMDSTVFEAEGVKPRQVKLPRGVSNFTTDEHIRATSLEDMARLSPAFRKEGVQTAANSSGIVDGAAAVVIARKSFVNANNLKPLSKIIASATCGIDPYFMGLGPVPSIRLLLEMTSLDMDEIGLIEINEAFAAQYIGCERELGLDREKVNINGGSIALGHPLAASGARLSHTLSRSMKEKNVQYGIASACIGGGQGIALLLENPEYISVN